MALLMNSVDLKLQVIDMLRGALHAGELDDYGDRPREDLFNLQQNLIVLLTDLDHCEEADTYLDMAESDRDILPESASVGLDAMATLVIECRDRVASVVVATDTTDTTDGTDEVVVTDDTDDVDVTDGDRSPGGDDSTATILLVSGGALILGGVAYDLALSDDRDEFSDLQTICESGCSDTLRAAGQELQSTLDDGALYTGLLYGVGLVLVVAGVVNPSDGAENNVAGVRPTFGNAGYGVSVWTDF
jgi:hypothetical protein